MAKLGFSCKRCVHFCTKAEKARVIFKGYCDSFESVAKEVALNNTLSEQLGIDTENRRLEIMKEDWEKFRHKGIMEKK